MFDSNGTLRGEVLSKTKRGSNAKRFKNIEAICMICELPYIVGLRKIPKLCSKECWIKAVKSGKHKIKEDI